MPRRTACPPPPRTSTRRAAAACVHVPDGDAANALRRLAAAPLLFSNDGPSGGLPGAQVAERPGLQLRRQLQRMKAASSTSTVRKLGTVAGALGTMASAAPSCRAPSEPVKGRPQYLKLARGPRCVESRAHVRDFVGRIPRTHVGGRGVHGAPAGTGSAEVRSFRRGARNHQRPSRQD